MFKHFNRNVIFAVGNGIGQFQERTRLVFPSNEEMVLLSFRSLCDFTVYRRVKSYIILVNNVNVYILHLQTQPKHHI